MNSPEITLSFNEIMFFFSRAAMGVGLPYGLSEDFGRISVWIAASGLDPAAITSNALKSIDEAQSSLCSSQTENDTETILKPSEEKQLSALMAGPTVCDWISTKDTEITEYKNYCTKNIDYPFLIAAAVGALNNGNWEISWQDYKGFPCSVLTDQHGNWKKSWDSAFDISSMSASTNVIIKSVDSSFFNTEKWKGKTNYYEKNRERILETGVKLYDTWPIIHSYFCRCLVPSTEETRISGAGAGLVDTD